MSYWKPNGWKIHKEFRSDGALYPLDSITLNVSRTQNCDESSPSLVADSLNIELKNGRICLLGRSNHWKIPRWRGGWKPSSSHISRKREREISVTKSRHTVRTEQMNMHAVSCGSIIIFLANNRRGRGTNIPLCPGMNFDGHQEDEALSVCLYWI